MLQKDIYEQADIGSGNGLVLSGNNPLAEPMLIQLYVNI